ncbi:MAG: hypothetical protein HZA51_16280 [Planctomycetes bacterium]|nr:hypothetical protein [Planctomycetota bacterium]
MFSKVGIWILVITTSNAVSWAADPQLYLDWDESPPPVEGVAYVIDDTVPAYPSVELVIGSQTWRIWSMDPDNPGGVGDIGVISCPHPENFGIKILDPNGGPGARNVLGIALQPSAGSNYSRIINGNFSAILGNLSLQKSSGGTGGNVDSLILGAVGTETTLSIPGGVTGDVEIAEVEELAIISIGSLASSTISPALGEEATLSITEVGELADISISQAAGAISIHTMHPSSNMTVSKFEPSGTLDVTKMEDGSTLFLSNMNCDTESGNATAHVADMYGAAEVNVFCPGFLEVLVPECECGTSTPNLAVTIDQMNDNSSVNYGEGLGTQEQLVIGAMAGTSDVVCTTLKGTITLLQGIAANCTVTVSNSDYGSTIDLNDEPVAGTLEVVNTSYGLIVNGGDVSGSMLLCASVSGSNFSGSATVSSVSGSILTRNLGVPADSGQVIVTGDLSGLIEVNGNVSGSVYVHGDVAATGVLEVLGALEGASIALFQDIEAGGRVSVLGNMTGTSNVGVVGITRGLIHIAGTMSAQSLIQSSGGLDSGSLIDVNTNGGSSSTTAGTIWIGGSATQNPLPPVTMQGTVRVNCPALSKTFAGQVKVVGCATGPQQTADICVYGTIPPGNRPILYVDKNCTYKYGTSCTTGCGS